MEHLDVAAPRRKNFDHHRFTPPQTAKSMTSTNDLRRIIGSGSLICSAIEVILPGAYVILTFRESQLASLVWVKNRRFN